MAHVVRRVTGRDGSLTDLGRARRVTGRFADTKEGRKAAAEFAASLYDVETLYDVRTRVAGRVQTRTFVRRKDADTWMSQLEASKVLGVVHDPTRGRVTFREIADRWFEARTAKRPRSIDRDREILTKHVYPTLGASAVSSITRADIQRIVDGWSVSPDLAPSTVARQYSCVRAVFSWAVSADLIDRTPCRGIKLPQVPRLRRRRITSSDLERLADELGAFHAPMMWTGVVTGLRWSEVAGRQVRDIDLARQEIAVSKQLNRKRDLVEPKSAAGKRTLAIPAWLSEELAAHLARRGLTAADGDALVFVGVKGGPLNYSAWRRTVWAPACQRAGLPGLGFHDLRRLNATELVAAGADAKVAQTRLGHADPRLTLRLYAEVTEEADRAAAEALGERLRPRARRAMGHSLTATDAATFQDRNGLPPGP